MSQSRHPYEKALVQTGGKMPWDDLFDLSKYDTTTVRMTIHTYYTVCPRCGFDLRDVEE
jgi:hypothetical protein